MGDRGRVVGEGRENIRIPCDSEQELQKDIGTHHKGMVFFGSFQKRAEQAGREMRCPSWFPI